MPIDDPQWSERGRTGLRDLGEIWHDVRRRWSKDTGDSGSARPRRSLPLGALLAALVVLVWLVSGFYIVDEGRRGVVTRFGKYVGTTTPGLRWHLPYPIESAEVIAFSEVRTVEVGYRNSNPWNKIGKESLMLTDDENIIDIQLAVQYSVKNAPEYVFNTRRPDDIVSQVAVTAMSEVVGRSQMDFALYEGRPQIAAETEKLMQAMLDRYGTGIYIQRVTLQNAQPPEQVQAAFDDAVKAGQDRERQKNEGQAYANDVVPRARGMASRLLQEADGYGASVVQKAEGDASRFKQILAEYVKAPAVTRERLYLDMLQSVLDNSSKVLVDQKAGNSLLYLPIDQLIRQGQPAPMTDGGVPPESSRGREPSPRERGTGR